MLVCFPPSRHACFFLSTRHAGLLPNRQPCLFPSLQSCFFISHPSCLAISLLPVVLVYPPPLKTMIVLFPATHVCLFSSLHEFIPLPPSYLFIFIPTVMHIYFALTRHACLILWCPLCLLKSSPTSPKKYQNLALKGSISRMKAYFKLESKILLPLSRPKCPIVVDKLDS